MFARFKNRLEAGRALGRRLARYAGRPDVLVLALPRGGVPVAAAVARELSAPLDVYIVRKLGLPGQEELAMGAIASGGVRVLNSDLLNQLGVLNDVIDAVTERERAELERRERVYRGHRVPPEIKGKTVLLIDDGLATGATMRAAIVAVRKAGAARVVAAAPVAPADACVALGAEADEVVTLFSPEPFHAIGVWYEDFSQVGDDEVRRLLASAASAGAVSA